MGVQRPKRRVFNGELDYKSGAAEFFFAADVSKKWHYRHVSSTGIARSRVCALPHVHINSQGSRPSLCGLHNVEVLGASGTKKSRFGAWKVKSLVLAQFKLRPSPPAVGGCAHLAW